MKTNGTLFKRFKDVELKNKSLLMELFCVIVSIFVISLIPISFLVVFLKKFFLRTSLGAKNISNFVKKYINWYNSINEFSLIQISLYCFIHTNYEEKIINYQRYFISFLEKNINDEQKILKAISLFKNSKTFFFW